MGHGDHTPPSRQGEQWGRGDRRTEKSAVEYGLLDMDGGGTHDATAARDETYTKSINSTVNVRNWTDSVNYRTKQ